MKKFILVFTILVFLFSVNLLARMEDATNQVRKTESTHTKIVKSEARPSIPEGTELRSISRLQAAPIDENYTPVTRETRGGIANVWEENFEPEHDLFYYANISYLWTLPDEHSDFVTRFTPWRNGFLDGAWIYFYAGDATSVDVTIYGDNGGYPGTVFATVPYTPAYVGWEYVDLSSVAAAVSSMNDFYIGVGNATGGTPYAQIVSDDATSAAGVSRSFVYDAGWYTCAEYYGGNYEWVIDAMITYNDPWTSALGKWNFRTDAVPPVAGDSAHSATHCWQVDEEPNGAFKDFLTSPTFKFDVENSDVYSLYNLSFWMDIEFMRSGAGTGFIDETIEVWMTDVDDAPEDYWHIDSFNGYNATNSWWCGVTDPGYLGGWGYGTTWNQWVQTPVITLPAGVSNLDFMHRYDCELDYDYCYVEISSDGWTTMDQLAVFNGTSNTWAAATQIDLGTTYAGMDVSIRFRFESDGGWDDTDGGDTEGAWFIDDVVISDASRAILWQDNADDEVNFIVNDGNLDWARLFYDYDRDYPALSTGWELVDNTTIFNGTCNITNYAGKNVQLLFAAQVDDSLFAEGKGLYIDDIVIEAIGLPAQDVRSDFLVVPYPQTEDAARSITTPKLIYHQAGTETSTPEAECDIVGIGNDYPLKDYFGLSLSPVAMNEYALGELQYQDPTFGGLEAGFYNYLGWQNKMADVDEVTLIDGFAPDTYAKVYPPGEYELGYNARTIGNFYYPGCTGAVVLYTPFTDGVFAAPETYEINGISHMLYNRGLDYGTEACLTFTIYDYDPLTPLQFGTELYTEEICFATLPEERFTWIEIPFSTPVTVTDDYWVYVSGAFDNGVPVAHEVGNFDYYMLVDSELLAEDFLAGGNIYAGHSFNYNPAVRYTLEEYPSNFYINTLVNTAVPSTLNDPQNVTITEAAGTVTVSWEAVRFATGYNVYSDTDPYGAFTTAETTFPTGLLTWSESTTDVKKFYIVKAVK